MKNSAFKELWLGLTAHSIIANVNSLLGQVTDYKWLTVNEDQRKRLEKIDRDLHALVEEITQGEYIVSLLEVDDETGERLYWSIEDGWVSKMTATVFPAGSCLKPCYIINGVWAMR